MVTLDARVALSVLCGCRLVSGAFGIVEVNTPARLVQSLTESKPPRQPAASNRIPEGLAVPGRWRKAVRRANGATTPVSVGLVEARSPGSQGTQSLPSRSPAREVGTFLLTSLEWEVGGLGLESPSTVTLPRVPNGYC